MSEVVWPDGVVEKRIWTWQADHYTSMGWTVNWYSEASMNPLMMLHNIYERLRPHAFREVF